MTKKQIRQQALYILYSRNPDPLEGSARETVLMCIEDALMKAQPLVDELNYLLTYLGGACPDMSNARSSIAETLASYAGSAEGEKERPCNPTQDSDALMEPPSFEQMVGLIKKNFRDVLELSAIKDEGRIAKAWERYKCLNHLYRDGEAEKKDPWIRVEDKLPELGTQVIVARPNQYSGRINILMAYLHDSGEKGRSCGEMYEYDWLYGKYWSLPAVVKLNTITHWMPLPEPPAATNQEGGKK